MLNYISLYPNEYKDSFNDEIILGTQDRPIEDFIIMAMKELEAIENIDIINIETVTEQDKIDINMHSVNINYKRKDMSTIEFPQYKSMYDSRYGEIIFTIDVHTNLHQRIIEKRILYPVEHNGFYYNNGKKMKAIWQLVDAATYSQRGKNTLKSRMPIIVYQNKKRQLADVNDVIHIVPSYSYALNTKSKKPGSKVKTKFINPILLYSAKMGFAKTVSFFGMDDIVYVDDSYNESDLDLFEIFPLDNLYLKVDKHLFEKYDIVRSFVAMVSNARSKDFPLDYDVLEDKDYWIERIGTIGSAKNKNLASFYEKGKTTIYLFERLLDQVTIENLRLPMYYKQNVYYLIYWIMLNFDELRRYSNIDMRNKRIRKNEYIVMSSLGKKINENINKIIEKRGKSKMNTMDTLLELFNFPSDIIVSGMRSLNDLIKTDDIVNDLNFVMDIAYSAKGYQSIGDSNVKKIANKYRYLHPSMCGVLDLNVSSNSDVGMSGSFVPTVKLYDKFYFTPEPEYCLNRYLFDKELKRTKKRSFDTYIEDKMQNDEFKDLLQYEKIEIVEKEPQNIKIIPPFNTKLNGGIKI